MCGVFGIFGHPNGKQIAKTGIWTLQHRGQDAAGISCLRLKLNCRYGLVEVEKRSGKVREVLRGPDFDDLEGDAWIAHVRYSTQGKPSRRNAQPHYAQSIHGKIAIVSNGDVVNMDEQREFLDRHDIRTYTENDAELIAAAINYQVTARKRDVVEAIAQVMNHVRGAFSSLVITEFDDRLFAFRDPYGIRPLFFGTVEDGGAKYYMFASETAALEAVMPLFGSRAVLTTRMVEAGEIIAVGPRGVETFRGPKADRQSFCIFEYVYFSRPDSRTTHGESFQTCRMRAGEILFREAPVEADLVTPIPKSGIPMAVGFALASGLPFIQAIVENPSFDIDFEQMRTFIGADVEERRFNALLKFCFTADLLEGRRVVDGDDSIVRGLITGIANNGIWRCGAKEIHTRISSPPYRFPCFYGVETKDRHTLAAAGKTLEEVRRLIGQPTTLAHLSLEGLVASTGRPKSELCTACFDGDYPIPVQFKENRA
ncbi:MAG: amidophosphoribosyltransferase [Patescibacteria group bacterium]